MKSTPTPGASSLALPLSSAAGQRAMQAWIAVMPIAILLSAMRGLFSR